MTMTGAEALVQGLELEGVSVVFGYPGGAILPVYDALRNSNIKHVLVRQEQGGAHAASGYARVSGKTGVCMATSGPGATNLVTGLANAYMDSTPMVVITGQVARSMVGTDAFQEVDITGITHPITKHNYLVQEANDIPRIVKEAFHIASTGRPGPVLIDIPKDVAEETCTEKTPDKVNLPGYKPTMRGHAAQVKLAAQLMMEAKRPVLAAGGGAILADASDELEQLAEMIQAPVMTTLMGLGSISTVHDLFLGMPGMHGHPSANKAIMECDLLVTVGMRFDDRLTGAVAKFAPQAKIIHIDIDPAEIGKNVRVNVPIVGHVKLVLQSIIERLKPMKHNEWFAKIRQWKNDDPPLYMEDGKELTSPMVLQRLNELTAGDMIVTTDVGQHQMFAAQLLHLKHPKSFITSGGLGTMGYGFPAAIGVKIAKPEARVVCITGDGSFQMSMNELATAKEQGLPIKVLLFNNCCLGLVRQLQHFYCDRRQMAVDFTGNPDFVKLAEAYGIKGYRINHPGEIDTVLQKALGHDELTIIECVIRQEEYVNPNVLAGKGLDEMVLEKGGNHE